ncbi:hypothetical protein [Stenotrophomonas maltophilia]|uniref:hypothetical protein n=1 Tax=Stenotrophomonas maltophilia TaxID=40324 RepID=UPI00066E9854|nr:hypothetical protein [Stenotrophomonas maltophilia]
MKFTTLARRAAKDMLEAEDLIAFVQEHGAEGGEEIERLRILHGWPDDGLLGDGSRVVPFGGWAKACTVWGRQGIEGLRDMLGDPQLAVFALGTLADVSGPAAVAILLDFAERADWSRAGTPRDLPCQALYCLNTALSGKTSVEVTPGMQASMLRIAKLIWDAREPNVHFLAQALYFVRRADPVPALAWVEQLRVDDPVLVDAQRSVLKRLKEHAARD